MKFKLRLFVCLLVLSASPAIVAGTTNFPAASRPALWFPVGEELVFRVYWAALPVGTARVTTEWVEENGRVLLAIRGRTKTNRILEKIYPVNDFIESLVDPVTFLPLRFYKQLSEGGYKSLEITTFDHARLIAHWESVSRKKAYDCAIEPDTRDILSFMYYMRQKHFEPGKAERYRVMADEKVYDVTVKPEKIEPVKLPLLGPTPSLKIEPEAAFQGLFVRKGRVWLWVSEDSRRVCTKIEASIPVANVKALLWEIGGASTNPAIQAVAPTQTAFKVSAP